MYNVRYHIASLVSVFLALALGLVLGGLIVDKTPTTSQSSLVTGLKQEFETLRADNDNLQTSMDAYGNYSAAVTKRYMGTMLEGKTIAVLGLNNKATELAHDDIVATGGKAELVDLNFDKLDMKNADAASTQLITQLKTSMNATDDKDVVAQTLALEWDSKAKTRPLTDALIKDGVLKMNDYNKFKGVDGVVNTAIDGDRVDTWGLALTEAFKAANKPVLCASIFQGNNILAERGWKNELSSTNMLSTSIGTYTIAAVMSGADEGLYGTMEGAKAVYPPFK